MNGKKYINKIIDLLSYLSSQIETAGGLHLYDRHIHSEDFFKRFLNLLYGYELVNVNLSEPNFPAIDLGDKNAKKCIQVTSDSSPAKIRKTIALFNENRLYEEYAGLTILIITKKGSYARTVFDTGGMFDFDIKRDIIDKEDIIKEVAAYPNIEDIKKVCEFLEDELDRPGQNGNPSNEVETIMDLVAFLSDGRGDGEETVTGDPDPEKKIMQRFASESDHLKTQIQEYLPLYHIARKEAESKLGLDKAMIILIRRFLMDKSLSILESCDQNPKKALEELVDYFAKELKDSGKHYDHGAIKYYLLQEIINCNVFPNPVR